MAHVIWVFHKVGFPFGALHNKDHHTWGFILGNYQRVSILYTPIILPPIHQFPLKRLNICCVCI